MGILPLPKNDRCCDVYEQGNPITGLGRPLAFREVEAPRFPDSRHMKVAKLSALRTRRLDPQEILLIVIYITG